MQINSNVGFKGVYMDNYNTVALKNVPGATVTQAQFLVLDDEKGDHYSQGVNDGFLQPSEDDTKSSNLTVSIYNPEDKGGHVPLILTKSGNIQTGIVAGQAELPAKIKTAGYKQNTDASMAACDLLRKPMKSPHLIVDKFRTKVVKKIDKVFDIINKSFSKSGIFGEGQFSEE